MTRLPYRLLRNPVTWVAILVLTVAAGFGLYWFQPWKLVTDQQVAERLSSPEPVGPVLPDPTGPGPTPNPGGSGSPVPAGPVLVSQGAFVSHEHDTTGTARIVREPGGGYRLELVGLNTSNGPDLRVWLTDQPVREGKAGWHVFDDGERLELGRLKGNRGDQVYRIPAGTDLTQLRSVSIWCKRFAVSFGAAELRPTGGS